MGACPDIVTTTHKTLRGPRGGLVFARAALPEASICPHTWLGIPLVTAMGVTAAAGRLHLVLPCPALLVVTVVVRVLIATVAHRRG